jgi:Matrixin
MRIAGIVVVVLLSCGIAQADEPTPETASVELSQPFPRDEFLIIPLRVYRLRADHFPAAECRLEQRDFERILPKVNRVWAMAGIHFGLESIREEQADVAAFARVHRTLALLQQDPHARTSPSGDIEDRSDWKSSQQSGLFKALIPASTREFAGFRVYYIQDFDVNGIYFGRREAMVKATARLRPVPGGIDEPLPRVTAHELGHGLGLAHRQDRINLMASGTTGTSFNQAEVDHARSVAKKIPGMIRFDQLSEQIAKEQDNQILKQLQQWKTGVEQIATPAE